MRLLQSFWSLSHLWLRPKQIGYHRLIDWLIGLHPKSKRTHKVTPVDKISFKKLSSSTYSFQGNTNFSKLGEISHRKRTNRRPNKLRTLALWSPSVTIDWSIIDQSTWPIEKGFFIGPITPLILPSLSLSFFFNQLYSKIVGRVSQFLISKVNRRHHHLRFLHFNLV